MSRIEYLTKNDSLKTKINLYSCKDTSRLDFKIYSQIYIMSNYFNLQPYIKESIIHIMKIIIFDRHFRKFKTTEDFTEPSKAKLIHPNPFLQKLTTIKPVSGDRYQPSGNKPSTLYQKPIRKGCKFLTFTICIFD